MKKAFTLAEVLITLTVIGIVAAISIPSLTSDINEKAWNTQRKALFARFSQAIPLLPAIGGYGTLTGTKSHDGEKQVITADTAAETFVLSGLSKIMKINNICYNDNLADCGFPETFTALGGNTSIKLENIKTLGALNSQFLNTGGAYEQLDTKAAGIETVNGESVLVYYNPNCVGDLKEKASYFVQPKMCANFIYDLNGSKAPNMVGKDIGFITVLYPTDSVVVAPMPLVGNAAQSSQINATKACKSQDEDSRLPNKDELAAMFYNKNLINITSDSYWSSSVITAGNSGTSWRQNFNGGSITPDYSYIMQKIRCVKR